MNAGADPRSTSQRESGRRLLVYGLLVLPVAVLLLWWAGGLRSWAPPPVGFSRRPIHISLTDARFEEVLATICSGNAVHFSDPELADMRITVVFPPDLNPIPEADLLTSVAETTETIIVMGKRGIEVRGIPLLERSYRWTSNWTRQHGGWSLWPNR